jgi:DNA-binding transcriptional MerR regulator
MTETETNVSEGSQPAVESKGGQQPAEQGKTFSTEDVDRIVQERLKSDRESLEKELGLGMKLKDIKAVLKAHKEAEDAKKSELERHVEKNKELEGALSTTQAELLKLRLAIDAQIPLDKLPKVLKYVNGSTEEEITASIVDIKADWGMQSQLPGKVGTGTNPANPATPPGGANLAGMTRAELAEKSKDIDWYRKNQDAIMKALEKGEIK